MDENRIQPKPTLSDARSYLNSVKEAFQDEPAKYKEFLMILVVHRLGRANDDTVGIMMKRIKQLFKGHQQLILGLKKFLSDKLKTILMLEDEQSSLKDVNDLLEIISFINEVKLRFQDDDPVYKSFLNNLSLYRKDSKELSQEVAILFRDHRDLYMEFKNFKTC